jgi:hypothetical protein
MAYATVTDVQERLTRALTLDEQNVCGSLLDDAAVIIDTYNANASADAKKVVSCRMVIRAIGSGGEQMTPIGATQGSMSALGYSQSWTIGSGATGELYIGKLEKQLLGAGNKIGSYSPIEALVPVQDEPEVS